MSGYEGLLRGATTPELDQARAGINQAVFRAAGGATAGGNVGQVGNLSYEPISWAVAGIVQASATISQTEATLVTAQAGLAAEHARLELMQAGARPEQVKAAEAQVAAAQTQAALNVLDEQLARMTGRGTPFMTS